MTAAAHPGPSKRVQFVDLLRGWAVIVMIETHVMNATVRPDIRESMMFVIITFVNGLVAPSFIFASGMAFAITAYRKHAEFTTPGKALIRQVVRLLIILGLGYMLHLPGFSLQYLMHEATAQEWKAFCMVDVLQCIAVTLLALQIGFFVLTQVDVLQGVWTSLYNAPFAPLTRFNNTVVMGSLVLGLVLAVPVYLGMKRFIVAYRTHIGAKVEKWKIYQRIKQSTLIRWYERVRDLGS